MLCVVRNFFLFFPPFFSRVIQKKKKKVPVHVSLQTQLFIKVQTCIQIIPPLGLKGSLSQNTEGKKWSLQHI